MQTAPLRLIAASIASAALCLQVSQLRADHDDTVAPAAELVVPQACVVGARCNFHVRVACPTNASCSLEPAGRIGAFEVLEIGAPQLIDGAQEWSITVIGFEPAHVAVAPLIVAVTSADGTVRRVTTPSREVDLSLPKTPGGALADITQPFQGGRDLRPLVFGALVALVFVVALVLVWRVVRSRRSRAPDADPWDAREAMRRLRRLEHVEPATSEDILRWYGDVLDIVKRHMEWAFSLPAPPLTSSELSQVVRMAAKDDRLVWEARELFATIDAVKFGAQRPRAPHRRATWERAVAVTRAVTAVRGARLDQEPGRGV